ncbi:hypothetical protein BLNAU_19405 [Blattamonas nauphoetae]|uniref:Uncharacterized protein n=1 Tax=Blattamonas nauphoetae TaxID=2049346 RepID=A0ABQ9X4U4_9EUKA|nr:hypothetical protein BLNAU_19405 [Blattamonas nauphoetae]
MFIPHPPSFFQSISTSMAAYRDINSHWTKNKPYHTSKAVGTAASQTVEHCPHSLAVQGTRVPPRPGGSICVPSTPLLIPNSFFLPCSRLLRLTRAPELSGTSETPEQDLTHVHVVRLTRVVELVHMLLGVAGDTNQDETTRQGMSPILANELLSSLLVLPTLRSDGIDAKRVAMWNTSLKEEGLDDFLCCFFNDGVQPCATYSGYNCTLPISPVLKSSNLYGRYW